MSRPNASKSNDKLIARFQSETDALSYEKEPVMARRTLWIVGGAIALAIGVSSQVKIDRIVTGTGQLITHEPTIVVQSLNRSIISSIRVREGDRVKAGDVLATLDPTFVAADVAQLEVQIESFDAEIARLQAELDDKPLLSIGLSERYAASQTSLMAQRAVQRAEQLRSFDSKIAQQEATIVKLQNDQKRYGERAKIMKEVENMRQQLADKQVGSRLHLLQAMDQRLEVLRSLDYGTNAVAESQHAIETTRSEREAFLEQWRTQVNSDLVQRRTARDAAAEQLSKARKNHDLVELKAPTDAVVQRVAKLSVGSVLTEAAPLFTLVPARAQIEAEVSIDARDIGFLRAQDPGAVKLEAYNYLEHGHVEGRVKVISEDAYTTQGDDGRTPVRPYYKANVVIERSDLVNVPAGFRMLPGMPVTADIKVGTRTLLSYVSHGITRSLNEAMREP
jgi:hemolysin D